MISIKTEKLAEEHPLVKLGFSWSELEKAVYKCIPLYGTKIKGTNLETSCDKPVIIWDSVDNKFTLLTENPSDLAKLYQVENYFTALDYVFYSYGVTTESSQLMVGWRYYITDLSVQRQTVQFVKLITQADMQKSEEILRATGAKQLPVLISGTQLVINMEYKDGEWVYLYSYIINSKSRSISRGLEYLHSMVEVERAGKTNSKYAQKMVSAYGLSVLVLTELLNKQDQEGLWGHKVEILKPYVTQALVKDDFYPQLKAFDLTSKVNFKHNVYNLNELKSEPLIRFTSYGTRATIPLIFKSGGTKDTTTRIATATVDIIRGTEIEIDIEIKSKVGSFEEERHYRYKDE